MIFSDHILAKVEAFKGKDIIIAFKSMKKFLMKYICFFFIYLFRGFDKLF